MGIEEPTAHELEFCDRVREYLKVDPSVCSNENIFRFTFLSKSLPESDEAFVPFCESVSKDLEWREKVRPEQLLEEYHSPRLPQVYKLTFFGSDKTGHPVVYTCPGQMQPATVFGEFDPDDLDRWYISIMEYGRRLYEPTSGGNGKHLVLILDLNGIGMAHADMRLINWIRGRSAFDVHHYPNAFCKIYVVNAGWAFTGVWTLVKPILPTSTVELVEILGGQAAYLPKLLERIDKQNIPDFLGGDAGDIFATPTLFGSSNPDAKLGAMSNMEKLSYQALGREMPKPFREFVLVDKDGADTTAAAAGATDGSSSPSAAAEGAAAAAAAAATAAAAAADPSAAPAAADSTPTA